MNDKLSQFDWEKLVQQFDIAVIILNEDGIILYANDEAAEIFSCETENLLGTLFGYPASGETRQEIEIFQLKKTKVITVEMHVRKIDWSDQKNWLVTLLDISERKYASERMQLASKVFSNAREGIIITDQDSVILEVNKAFVDLMGFSAEEIIGKRPSVFHSGLQDREFYKDMWTIISQKGSWTGEIWDKRKSGEILPLQITVTGVVDDSGFVTHYIGVYQDITLIKQQKYLLQRQKYFDEVTGLPNQDMLQRDLKESLQDDEYSGAVVLICFSCKCFEAFSRDYGKDFLDEFCVALVERLKDVFPSGSTIYRTAESEFIVYLRWDKDFEELKSSAMDWQSLINQDVQLRHQSLTLNGSLGVYYDKSDKKLSPHLMVFHAREVLYETMLSNFERVKFYDERKEYERIEFYSEAENLLKAIEGSELILNYQPKVYMRTGELTGVEALLRWQHASRGLLSPNQFIKDFDNHPVSKDISEWVFRQAVAQLDSWNKRGVLISVSVNVSAYFFLHQSFLPFLKNLLAEFPSLAPGQLTIEILETVGFEDTLIVNQLILECKKLGVHCSIDDFGTGYSTLAYLNQLSVDEVKIDQSFVREMIRHPQNIAIIGTTIELCRSLRREVIAEGVETLQIGMLLLQLGCEIGQGYAIAKPMPAQEFDQWYQEWQVPTQWTQQTLLSEEGRRVLLAAISFSMWLSDFENETDIEVQKESITSYQCPLCTWLKTHSAESFIDSNAYSQLANNHHKAHECCQKIVVLKLANENWRYYQAVSSLNSYSGKTLQASLNLFTQQ